MLIRLLYYLPMERMGTEYNIFNWKEYVSLRRFWNMEWKYKTEKAKNEELEEENKALKITVDENNLLAKDYVELKEENKKLKEELEKLKDIQSWKVICLWWFGV